MVKLGAIVAWILVVYGVLRFSVGFYVAYFFVSDEDYVWATKRYIGTASSGEAMDQGVLVFVVGLVIGLIVKIAKKAA